jgi:integration host factor subunit beta
MATTTKKDLIDRIAEETNQKRTSVKQTVQSFLENVIKELSEGNRLEFRDFGVFEIRERAPRIAQNPKTLERVPVPAKKTVKFKVGRLMKLALEGELDDGEPATDEERAAAKELAEHLAGQLEAAVSQDGSSESENS